MSAEVRHEVNRVLVEGLDAFEDMREQRDQALIRADAAEADLVAERGEVKQLRAALVEVRRVCAIPFPPVSAVLDVVRDALDGAQ